MGIELAVFSAMAAGSVYEGIEQQRAGKAAKAEGDKAAAAEKGTAALEAGITADEQHETLVEGNYARGSLMAIGAGGGLSTKRTGAGLGSLGTIGERIRAKVRSKMLNLQKRTSLSMRGHELNAREYKRQGKRAYKSGLKASYLSFAKAGIYSFAGYSSLGSPSTGGGSMIKAGGKSAGGGNPYFL